MLAELELRQEGRELVGVILQEGRAATGGRAEVFAPNSVQWPADGIDILPMHRGAPAVKAIPERQPDGRISIRAAATDALRQAYAEGRRHLSVEFHAIRHTFTKGGVREIQKAMVVAAAMVKTPEYSMAVAELRQGTGQTLQAIIPAGVPVECECSTPKCRYAHFEPKALREVSRDSFEKRTKEVLIGYNNYQHPLGSVSKGTLRGKMVGDDLQIEVDIPDTQSGLELIQAFGFAGLVVRPFIAADRSIIQEIQREDGDWTAVYTSIFLRAFLVSATDARKGWPEPRLIPTPTAERSALVIPNDRAIPHWKRRAAVWL